MSSGKSEFASAPYTAGHLNAVVKLMNAQGGPKAVECFLRGELAVVKPDRRWREDDGVIYFSVTSDGTTGEQWIARLESKGFRLSPYAKQLLLHPDFKPTSGITFYIAVLKGMLWNDQDRTTQNIRDEAKRREHLTPNPEIACLIREAFSDEELKAMGLFWIIVMHEPIKDSDGGPDLLTVRRGNDGQWLTSDWGKPEGGWDRRGGFAVVVSQVSA